MIINQVNHPGGILQLISKLASNYDHLENLDTKNSIFHTLPQHQKKRKKYQRRQSNFVQKTFLAMCLYHESDYTLHEKTENLVEVQSFVDDLDQTLSVSVSLCRPLSTLSLSLSRHTLPSVKMKFE
jgi:hypothetical protein